MHSRKDGGRWVVVLEKGEEIVSTLNGFFEKQNIKGGFLFGIGAVRDVEICAYNPKTKGYDCKNYPDGVFELLNLSGSASETGLHAHVTLCDHELRAFGGHLKKATVAATLELVLFPASELKRKHSEEIGLNLMQP